MTFIILGVWFLGTIFGFRSVARSIYYDEITTDSKREWGAFGDAATLGALAGALWPVWFIPYLVYKAVKGNPHTLASVAFGDLNSNSKLKLLEARSEHLDKWLNDDSDTIDAE